MHPPKLIKKPPQNFFDVQEQFMQRGFLEMKESIKKKLQEATPDKKEIDSIQLFTVLGDEISSFNDITPE
jgi:hypothetical protein